MDDYNVETGYKSELKCNYFGVPQGSILGPLLFVIYTNELPDIFSYKSVMFADDISFIVTSKKDKKFQEHECKVNEGLKTVIRWLQQHNLQININKTNYVQFNSKRGDNFKLGLQYKNENIKEMQSVTFLGVILDKYLDWHPQIDKIRKKLNSFVFVLRKLRRISGLQTTLAAYHGYVQSILRYGLILWGHCTYSSVVFVAQKKCIRAIYGLPSYKSCKPLFKKLNILPLPCLYILEICMFVKRHMFLFRTAESISTRSRRNPGRLVYDYVPKTALYSNNCFKMCIKFYNKLPQSLQELPLHKFKNKLISLLNQKCYYDIKEFLLQEISL